MISQTPRKRGRKRDLYTRIAKGKSHRPQKISAAKISWSCTEEQHGQRVPLRFFEYGQEIGAAHEYQGSSVVQHDEEVDGGWHHTTQDHHQRRVVLVHSLEQPVKSQREEDTDSPAEQVADDAK